MASTHNAKQLLFQNKLSFLVLLRCLVCLVVLPSYGFFALAALDIADNVAACCHASFHGVKGCDVYHRVEEVCFAMLASEVLEGMQVSRRSLGASKPLLKETTYTTDDVIVVCKVCLAVLAAEDLARIQVDVVGEAHCGYVGFYNRCKLEMRDV